MGITPSAYCRISDELAAFCFDRAVTLFGITVESEIDKVIQKAKSREAGESAAQRKLDKFLYADGQESKGRFADPALSARIA